MRAESGDLERLRSQYSQGVLSEESVRADPLGQFSLWYEEAFKARVREPTAMTLATVGPENMPNARLVLLKGFDARGFVFFTNYESRKAFELQANPVGALVFYWPELGRQVRMAGPVRKTSRKESEAYFATRPPGSQVGAWASSQSQVLSGRLELEARFKELEKRRQVEGLRCPTFWGGYRLLPDWIEFWQGRENRLHDRIRYRRSGRRWIIERLAP